MRSRSRSSDQTLHPLRSESDAWVRELMGKLHPNEEVQDFPLHRGKVDYDQLVVEIFENDRVLAWW